MQPKLESALLGAAVAVSLSLASAAMAADHRDAPTVDAYSAIDINDVFVFRDPPCTTPSCASKNLVIVLSTQAVADPQFAPSYHFQENALYQINFTTRSDAQRTASINVVFGPFASQPDCPTSAACQTYRAVFPNGIVVSGVATQGTAGATHLTPVIATTTTNVGPITAFAGPREDPFFFDLVGFNRSIASGTNEFTGVDAFLGKNINAIVLEFPVSLVFPAKTCTGTISASGFTTPCGVWAVTYLGPYEPESTGVPDANGLNQIDRMGNPAVNTALIPAALKDSFNFGKPKDDPTNFASVILNQILTLDKLFGTCPPTATSAVSCNPNVPLLASVAVPDTLKFALNLPDGFPNGRQLGDRVTDLLLRLIVQLPQDFTDGTLVKTYCPEFPFAGPPLQLSGSTPFEISRQTCP
ncbi:MAG: DUF4331 family protein [Mycobacterium sp.]|nr:DUF4331 family protein [Mycobacterium sp.]